MAGHRRARPVGGQLQRGGDPASWPLPVGELRLEHLALQPLALPDGVVRILDRQRRQRRLGAPDERRVERRSSRSNTPIDQPSETM